LAGKPQFLGFWQKQIKFGFGKGHDKNSVRRDLTTGQKAMAYALLFPEKEKRGPKSKAKAASGDNLFASEQIPRPRIHEARAIVKFAPGDIEAIKQGDEPFEANPTQC
jgi:hypothetical protein